MAFYNGLIPLRDILAAIYPAKSLARTVVVEAVLPETLIDFEGSALERWTQILSVAQNGRQVQAIIDVARNHFPRNEELIEAEEVFHNTPPPSGESGLEGLCDDTHYPVFDQRDQTIFGQQFNVKGDYQVNVGTNQN